ncbi:MAG: hypothetical protein R6V73_12225, partial [Anaerolineales bacterium]
GLEYHENQTVESALQLVEGWKKQAAAEGTPQSPTPPESSVAERAQTGTTHMDTAERLRLKGQGGDQ